MPNDVTAKETVTRAHISDNVYREVGLPRCESERLVKAVIDEVIHSLLRGEEVKIASFGRFVVRQKNRRIGRNPKTGEDAVISGRRALSFRAGATLKAKVESGVC